MWLSDGRAAQHIDQALIFRTILRLGFKKFFEAGDDPQVCGIYLKLGIIE